MADPESGREAIERIEQEEFARGHIGPDDAPVEPRPAATIVAARPERGSGSETVGRPWEVLLLRRPDTSRFAAGAYVFPGGVIDEADRDSRLRELLAGAGRAGRLETAALAAGLRELFEETGILPVDRPPDEPILGAVREALREDRVTLAEVAERLDLEFGGLRVAYISRWITPERLARRYDTRFFLLAPGAESWPRPTLTAEHTEFVWLRPAEALHRFRRGELPMLFPTWKTLERLEPFDDLDRALAASREAEPVTVRPRLVLERGRVRPVMPGDPDYELGR